MSRHLTVFLLFALPATSPAADPPKKEPAYAGKPSYCRLAFGREKAVVWLALDGDKLYVDRNTNGDLTDDGDPVVADGTGWRTFRVDELRVGGRTHRNLTLTVGTLREFGSGLASVTTLLAEQSNARSYRLTVEVEMPGHTGTAIGGRVRHTAGYADDRGVLQFAANAADAPLVHCDGPLVVAPDEPPAFAAGRQTDLMLVVGIRGEGPGTFAAVEYGGVIPAGAYPVAEVEYPPQAPGEPPARERYELKGRCCDYCLHGPVAVAETVGAGTATLKLTLDAWKDGGVAAGAAEGPVVRPTAESKLEPVSPRLKATLYHPSRRAVLAGVHFSPDGSKLIAHSCPENVVQLWDAATGRELTRFETAPGFGRALEYVKLAPDWSTAYVAVEGRNSRLVERDGKAVWHWTMSGEVRSWDLATGRPGRAYRADPPSSPYTLLVSPNGRWLVTGEERSPEGERQQGVSLWDLATGRHRLLPNTLQPHCAFTHDGSAVAVARHFGDWNHTVIDIIDAETAAVRQTLSTGILFGDVTPLAFSPDGRRLIVGIEEYLKPKDRSTWLHRVTMFDVPTGRPVADFAAALPKTYVVPALSPDGRRVAIQHVASQNFEGDFRVRVSVHDADRLTLRTSVDVGEKVWLTPTVFRKDGSLFATVVRSEFDRKGVRSNVPEDYPQPKALLFDATTGAVRATLVLPPCFCNAVAFSPDGKTLAVGGYGQVLLFDVGDL